MIRDRLYLLALCAIAGVGCQPSGSGPPSSGADFPWWDVGPAPDDGGSEDDDDHEDGVEALWFGDGSLAPAEWFEGQGGFSVVEYEGGEETQLCLITGSWASTGLRHDCGGCDFAFELDWTGAAVDFDDGSACQAYGVDPNALPQEPLLLGFSDDTAWSHDGEVWIDEGYADVDGDVAYWELPQTP